MENLKGSSILVKYLQHPHLIKGGYKYDIRYFVLVTGVKPLRIYLYEKGGFVKICTQKYTLTNFTNYASHITNFHFNSNKPGYRKPRNSTDYGAFYYTPKMLENYLNYHGYDFPKMKEKIVHLILLALFSVQHIFAEKKITDLGYRDSNFFHLFGYDIIFDEKFENPILLELNHRDTDFEFTTEFSPHMITETFNLAGMVPYHHNNDTAFDEEFQYSSEIEENVDETLCEFSRPRGGFRKIFPISFLVGIS